MNVVHTIVPNPTTNTGAQAAVPNPTTNTGAQAAVPSAFQAANYEAHVYGLVELSEIAAKAKNANDEHTTIHQMFALLDDWKAELEQRNDELKQVIDAEECIAMDNFAKQYDYLSWKQMSDYHKPPAESIDTVPPEVLISATSKHAPKVYKHVLRSDAKNLTADDEPGYIRLPKDQKESGKYREATAIEIAKFKSDLEAWETKHGSAKKL